MGSKSIFEKPLFKRWRNLFLNFQGGSPRVKRDSVNFTFNAFLNRKFSSRYIMVAGGPKGVVKIWISRVFSITLFRPLCVLICGGRGSAARGSTP